MTGSSFASVNIRNSRILVVDDNRVNRHLLMAVLQRGGFPNVSMAEDGIDALARIEESAPDLILLDLMMPRMDGFEVCRRVRANSAWKDLPILVQSSLSSSDDRKQAFSAGATDFVTKPINATELLSRVRIHLENQALLRDLQGYRSRRQTELALARSMQERLLPPPSRLAQARTDLGLSLSAHFEPSSELGGDFWDLRRDDRNRLIVWLVDFSGHGVGAALNTFRLHAILR
jgi:phosphoserine phosphatase RsbU/P